MVQCLPNPLDFYSPVFLVTHPCGGDEIIIIIFLLYLTCNLVEHSIIL